MTVPALSLEAIREMNLAATRIAAANISLMEEGTGLPEEDLELFFNRLQGKSILDIGCGWGRYANQFPEAGLEYVGVDQSPEFLALAKKAHPALDFQLMDFSELAFEDNIFDGIWGCCVFGGEPKAYVPKALAEILRVLKPDGLLFLILPNIGMSDEFAGEDWRFGPMYHSFWDSMEFSGVLRQNDQVAEVEVINREIHGSASFLITKKQ